MEWTLLRDVPAADIRELVKVARRRTFARNEVVFHRDDPADSLHLIVKGRYAVRVITPLGAVVTIAIRGPGETFGEMALVADEARRSATVASLEQGETLAIYRSDFERLRREHPSVDSALMRFLTAEIRTLNERLVEALHVPVEKRVLRRVLELSKLYAGDGGPGLIPVTQETVAELAGASRPTANQVLRAEERRGALELLRGRIRIVDVEGLPARAR